MNQISRTSRKLFCPLGLQPNAVEVSQPHLQGMQFPQCGWSQDRVTRMGHEACGIGLNKVGLGLPLRLGDPLGGGGGDRVHLLHMAIPMDLAACRKGFLAMLDPLHPPSGKWWLLLHIPCQVGW